MYTYKDFSQYCEYFQVKVPEHYLDNIDIEKLSEEEVSLMMQQLGVKPEFTPTYLRQVYIFTAEDVLKEANIKHYAKSFNVSNILDLHPMYLDLIPDFGDTFFSESDMHVLVHLIRKNNQKYLLKELNE